jgi:hypothetical protein
MERAPARAPRFLKDNLNYPLSFDALDVGCSGLHGTDTGEIGCNASHRAVAPGGVVLLCFTARSRRDFSAVSRRGHQHAASVVDEADLYSTKSISKSEIQDLFGRYRTMKSFVARDQLRETLS